MQIRMSRVIGIVAFLLVGLTVAGGAPARGEVGVTDTEILLGNSVVQSGPAAFFGKHINLGVGAYLKYINDQGGVHGRKIRYISYDDGYKPPRAVANAKRLIDLDKVFILFQNGGTPTTLAAYKYSHAKGVPIFLPNTFAHVLSSPVKADLFALGADYADQIRAIIDYLVKDRGFKRIGLFYQDDAYGHEGLRGAEERAKELGITLVAKEPYKRNSTDFSPQAAKLKKANAEGVAMMALAQSGSKVIREAAKLGYTPQWAGVTPMANKQLLQLGKEAVEGFLAAMSYPSEDSNEPGVVRYREHLKAIDPTAVPQQPGLWGYTSTMILVEVLKRAGRDLTRAKFLKAAESLKNFDTQILPPISYSASNHKGTTGVQFAQVKGGKFVYITSWK